MCETDDSRFAAHSTLSTSEDAKEGPRGIDEINDEASAMTSFITAVFCFPEFPQLDSSSILVNQRKSNCQLFDSQFIVSLFEKQHFFTFL